MNYFDAHCHLMDDSVFLNAQEKGVRSFIVNTTTPDEWEQVVALHRRITGVYCCFGMHPWFVENINTGWQNRLEMMLKRHPRAMIGEIGLDQTKPLFEKQVKIFQECMEIAARYERQVHIHCVGAWEEMLEILVQYREVKTLFHRFTGDEVLIQKLRLADAYFSVLNGRYLDVIPDNRLLVETDAPSGLRTPLAIPALVQALGLDTDILNLNFQGFINGN